MYRVQQFLRALAARWRPQPWAEVEALLTPAQATLFWTMPRCDQQHALDVARALRAAGQDEPDLLVAALLHDVAKSAGPLRLWHRVTIVLLKAFAPRWLVWLARQAEPGGWRYPFYVHRVHAEVGARWLEQAGGSALAVWLVAHHQSPEAQAGDEWPDGRQHLLAALCQADGQN